MKNTHPKYRVSQWLDTSEESMSKPVADIFYGVQAQMAPRTPWGHVSISGVKQIFDTPEKAAECIEKLKAWDSKKAVAA